jgi:hypothetical protein
VHGHLVAASKVKTELVDIAKLKDAAAQGEAEAVPAATARG